MLRSLPRAASSSSSIRGPSIRSSLRLSKSSTPVCIFDVQQQQRRLALAHAVSNPTLADIEKRWETMPPQEQAELWMALRDRMKTDWHELTLQEKKACEQPLRHTIPLNFVALFLATNNIYTASKLYIATLDLMASKADFPYSTSILDRIRTSRTSCTSSSWRGPDDLWIYHAWPRRLSRHLLSDTTRGPTGTLNYEQGISRSYERIFKGTLFSSQCVRCIRNLISRTSHTMAYVLIHS